jgi:hypothetical protein
LVDGSDVAASHAAAVDALLAAAPAQLQAALHLDFGATRHAGFDRIEVPPVCAAGALPNLDLVGCCDDAFCCCCCIGSACW